MSDPLATVSDLERRLRVEVGSLTGADLLAAEDAIGDVSALVHGAAADAGLVTPWTLGTIPDRARVVVLRVSARQYRNPEGLAQENIGGAYSYTLAQGETSAYLTTAEIGEIVAAVEAGSSPSSSPRRHSGTIRTPSAYSIGSEDPTVNWWVPGALTYEVP